MTEIIAPDEATAGESFPVSWTVHNQGGSEAAQIWQDRVYLSTDTTLDGADILIDTASSELLVPVAAGGSYTVTRDIPLQTTLSGGDRFLLVAADANRRQAETNESNNVVAVPID